MDNAAGLASFKFTSDLKSLPYYPSTWNWQKTLGGFSSWIYGDYTKSGKSIKINIKVKDMYNFNKDQQDIETGSPDNDNGRFAVLGWAKEFITYGTFSYSGTIT